MASTEENPAPVGLPDADAAWLSDLSLNSSRQRGVPDVEVAIMRLSLRPEFLHRFLEEGPEQVAPPAGVLIHGDGLLRLGSGRPLHGSGVQAISRMGAYFVSSPGAECLNSLEPQVFFPTAEDTRLSIHAEPDPSLRVGPRQGLNMPMALRPAKLAVVVIAIMLIGALLLA